jgi:hypothetical protein
LIEINAGGLRASYTDNTGDRSQAAIMTKPLTDKAEVALEFPDKLYIGTFGRSDRFDAHLDETGIWLSLHRTGTDDLRKTVRMHFRYGLFADILSDLAKTVNSMPASDRDHRTALRDATQALYAALQAAGQNNPDETSAPTANEEVRLLHIME